MDRQVEIVHSSSEELAFGQLAEQLAVAVELSPSPMFVLAVHDFSVILANHAALEFLAVSAEDITGLSLEGYVPERHQAEYRNVLAAFCDDEVSGGTLYLSAGDGVGMTQLALQLVGDTVVAVECRAKVRASSLAVAETDALTGVPNRRLLERKLQQAMQREDYDWGILFIDLNNYKQVNDRCGHVAGDQVLVEYASKLKASIRPGDVVTRYGGDEFVVLVDRIKTPLELRMMAERIAREVRVEVAINEDILDVSSSIGCAMACKEFAAVEEIVASADRDMYRVKRARLAWNVGQTS